MDVECALSPTIEFQSREHFSHFSHPHPLMLIDIKDSDGVYCSAYDKCLSGQGFVCSECSFVLHQSCFESPQEIRHQTPASPTLLGEYEIAVECNSCDISCNSSVFRCVDCNFNLHYTCGPLPYNIKPECHIDPLLLRDSPVEDDTYDEFYSDECEKTRDPRLPVYHCKECHYIAAIECVKSEVMLTLKGGYGDVELRNPAGRINGKVITNLELTEIEPEKEQNSNKESDITEAGETSSDDHIESIWEERLSGVSLALRTYANFMEKLDSGDRWFWEPLWEGDDVVVEVGDNMVTQTLAPILQDLCAKYGDISAESTLRHPVKTYLTVMLCGTLQSMRNTRIVDISENLMIIWWTHFKILQSAGFRVQFIFDQLKKVARAYFGLRVRENLDNAAAKYDKKITKISTDFEELRIKLEELKGKREYIDCLESSKKPSSIEDCLEEAEKLKWWHASAVELAVFDHPKSVCSAFDICTAMPEVLDNVMQARWKVVSSDPKHYCSMDVDCALLPAKHLSAGNVILSSKNPALSHHEKFNMSFTHLICDFDLHIKCTEIMPTISYKGHHHQLFFLENIDIECNFNLHHVCGPLPCTIKHECHIDPIILTDSPCEDDTYQFYCDACEKERDPRLSIYHCKECHFITEIKCVMSEIILTLLGEYGEVELKTPYRGMKGKVTSKKLKVTEMEQKEEQNSEKQVLEQEDSPVLSLQDMLMSFSEEDKMQVNRVLEVHRREMIKAKEISSTSHREDSNDNLEVSLFSDGAYKHFIEILDSKCSSLTHQDQNELCVEMLGRLTKSEEDEEFAKLRDILIMENLTPILQDLFDKYGDISVEYFSNLRVKLYFIVMLFGTVYSMRKTRIIDISENQLLTWWYFLKISQLSGLKVQFVLDRLEKVTHAYFGLQVRNKVDNTMAEIDREMTDISKEMEELTKKFEALKGKRDSITSAESSKSRFIEDCLEKATDPKWWPAGAGLL
ncbi:unnamed protein product [Dovyalis caffra]|uniref:DC1 domain-containing protein n=1 Tax=Dovyalis caffra TaxID=77055 RepID=A0AAV1RP84_9ROSI|nr:unnamed protein product [Dovyalis caffra]